jgi:Phage integrase family
MLFKRKDSKLWWARFTTPNGKRLRVSTGTENRKQAQEFADQLKAKTWNIQKLGEKPERGWQEVVLRWLDETSHKATQKDDIGHLRWLDPYLGSLMLHSITRDTLDDLVARRKQEGVSNATINRMLAVVRAILRRAALDWEWLDKIPKFKLQPEPKRRVRWLTQEEAARLINELPEHLAEMVRFTLATGLRQANMTQLEWSQVDLVRRVLDTCRSGKGEKSDLGAVKCRSNVGAQAARRQASNPGVHLPRQAGSAGEYQSLAERIEAGWDYGLSLARPSPYLGILACAKRDTVECTSGAGGLGIRGNSPPVWSPWTKPPSSLCRELVSTKLKLTRFWHGKPGKLT